MKDKNIRRVKTTRYNVKIAETISASIIKSRLSACVRLQIKLDHHISSRMKSSYQESILLRLKEQKEILRISSIVIG